MSTDGVQTDRFVSYDQQTTQHPNPLIRSVHKGRVSRSLSLVERHVPTGGVCVDFGAGTGLLLHTLKHRRPDARLFGIEPYMPCSYPQSAEYVAHLSDLPPKSVDVISAFEVCEHLYPEELAGLAADAKSTLKPGGKLIVSVPIMYGVLIVPKVLNKIIMYKSNNTGYDLPSTLKSLLGTPIPRPADPKHTHQGFDFRDLIQTLSRHFRIEQKHYHPFSALPWYVNSQIFMVCEKES